MSTQPKVVLGTIRPIGRSLGKFVDQRIAANTRSKDKIQKVDAYSFPLAVPLALGGSTGGSGTGGSGGGGGSQAPTDSTYVLNTADTNLPNAQVLASLSTGIMKVTTTTGVVSSLAIPLSIANGGTNATTAAAARASLLNAFAGNSLKFLRVNVGETDTEWATGAAGDVVGPASATDNAICRFDGTTGKLIQNSAVTIADTTGQTVASGAVSGGNMLSFTNSSTGASSTGVYAAATGATGATFGIVGYSGSSDNAAYGGYFSRGSSLNAALCAVGMDLAEMAAPDAPPTNFCRLYALNTDSKLYYKTDGGAVVGPLAAGTVTGTGTDNHVMRWDGTTAAQDSGWVIADTTNKMSISSSSSGSSMLDVSNADTTNGSLAVAGRATGASGALIGVVGDVTTSTTTGAIGVKGSTGGGTGVSYGVYGTIASSDNAAYSIYANEHAYLGAYADLAESSTPATPPSGSSRIWADTNGHLHIRPDDGKAQQFTWGVDTVTSSATPTINTDTTNYFSITALAANITSMTSNLSGTPVPGQRFHLAITGDLTPRSFTWGTGWESSAIVTLPTATNPLNRQDMDFIWNEVTSKWRIIQSS